MHPTMCYIRATIQFCPGRELREKKRRFLFFLNGTLLASMYSVSQFWHTHTHGGGTGQNATLKHFENE